MKTQSRLLGTVLLCVLAIALAAAESVQAASAEQMDRAGVAALDRLYATTPVTQMLAKEAKAVLIFPSVVKAGFIFGAEFGNGILREGGRTDAAPQQTAQRNACPGLP